MAELKIAKGLSLPAEAVTQTFGFIGRKGSGKTYAAGKLAETLLDAKAQVAVLDPVGNWFGLRLDRTGKKPSRFSLPILGGEHGDVPLEFKAGGLVADFVVSTGSSAVLDVSHFRKNQRKDFVTEFAEQLFHRKKSSRTPLHLIIEEAQVFAPEQGKGQERMLGAIEDLVRLGRNYGIGCSMISQRPQSVNKEVLNQAEPLVVFQLVAFHEREAVRKWMQHVGAEERGMLDQLPQLKGGDCFFWSPAWLGTFTRTRFLEKETFDASATPTLGTKAVQPQRLAPVDLDALKASMKDTIEKAKADDPKELKRQIAELRKQLAGQKPVVDEGAIARAVKAAEDARDRHWQRENATIAKQASGFAKRLQEIERLAPKIVELAHLNGDAAVAVAAPPVNQKPTSVHQTRPSVNRTAPVVHKPRASAESAEGLAPAHHKILNALAWLETMGVTKPSRGIVAAVAGVSPASSSYANNVSRLSSLRLVEYPMQGLLQLSDAGRELAEYPASPPTIEQLHESWRRCPAFAPAHVRILDAVIAQWPDDLSREELAEAIDVSPASSSFANNVSRLSSLGLIKYPGPGRVEANPELLFPEGVPQ